MNLNTLLMLIRGLNMMRLFKTYVKKPVAIKAVLLTRENFFEVFNNLPLKLWRVICEQMLEII
jgi:hypothetical protein